MITNQFNSRLFCVGRRAGGSGGLVGTLVFCAVSASLRPLNPPSSSRRRMATDVWEAIITATLLFEVR